jgi:hypothetical protein
MDGLSCRDAVKWVIAGATTVGMAIAAQACPQAPATRAREAVPSHAGDKPYAGNRSCTKCYCRQFEGNAYTCANRGCGHSYYDHW